MGEKTVDYSTEKSDFINLINRTDAFDKKKNWVYLSLLWYLPSDRKEFSRIVEAFLSKVIPNTHSDLTLLLLEGLPDTYSLSPIIYEFSIKRDFKLSIWRDTLPYSLSESWLIPHRLDKFSKCVIIQDATSKGSSLNKAADDLLRLEWQPEFFINLIQDDKDQNLIYLENNMKEFSSRLGLSGINKISLANISEL